LPEESQALALSATGLGTDAVAVRLGLSRGAVRSLIASAALKLGARSKLEAVVTALARGEIELPP
jgi:two-component system response regulator DesR